MNRLHQPPEVIAAAGVGMVTLLLLVALVVAALAAPVHLAAWAALVGAGGLAGAGLLYASRLGAFRRRRP